MGDKELPPIAQAPEEYTPQARQEYVDELHAERRQFGDAQRELLERKRLGEQIEPDLLQDGRRQVWAVEAELLRVDPQADDDDEDEANPRP